MIQCRTEILHDKPESGCRCDRLRVRRKLRKAVWWWSQWCHHNQVRSSCSFYRPCSGLRPIGCLTSLCFRAWAVVKWFHWHISSKHLSHQSRFVTGNGVSRPMSFRHVWWWYIRVIAVYIYCKVWRVTSIPWWWHFAAAFRCILSYKVSLPIYGCRFKLTQVIKLAGNVFYYPPTSVLPDVLRLSI